MTSTFKTCGLLFFVLACLLSLTVAVPANDFTDISSTSVDISEMSFSHNTSLVVSVQRVDDLVDDGGKVVAEKISAVIINFEFNDDNVLTLNSVPIELGANSIQTIEAHIIPGNVKYEDIQLYDDNFDIGLVMVDVRSFVESMPTETEGITISKISVVIRILEIDGVQIVQSDAVERVVVFSLLEIKNEGEDTELIPINTTTDDASTENTTESSPSSHHKPCSFIHSFVHWWKCSTKYIKIFIISLALTLLFGSFFLLLIPLAVNNLKLSTKFNEYQKILQENVDNEELRVEQVIFIAEEEKHALMGNDESGKE